MSREDVEAAFREQQAIELSMGMAVERPGMYSSEEMPGLMERCEKATRALDEALREDFRSMSPEKQKRMLEMLSKAGDAGRKMLAIPDVEQSVHLPTGGIVGPYVGAVVV